MSLFQGLSAGFAGGITWETPGRSHEKTKQNMGFIPTPKSVSHLKENMKIWNYKSLSKYYAIKGPEGFTGNTIKYKSAVRSACKSTTHTR